MNKYPGWSMPFLFLILVFLSGGCVRVAGSAGTWKTNAEGETAAKSVGFDTNTLIPGGVNEGKITV